MKKLFLSFLLAVFFSLMMVGTPQRPIGYGWIRMIMSESFSILRA